MTNLQYTTGHWIDWKAISHFISGVARVLFHVLLVALSAIIAFSLPYTVSVVARNFWVYWSVIERETIYLISVEVVTAIMLLLVFNYLGRSLRDRKIAKTARYAGLVRCFRSAGPLAQRRIKKLKNKQGLTRNVLVISSTGFRTFADPRGELHRVLLDCREAKIMLLNPRSEGTTVRAKSILDPSVTAERLGEQIKKSIDFLKDLRTTQKNIRLKLYGDAPFLKLAILGDYVWMKHYHPGLDVQSMPEYMIEHDQNPGGLYTPVYQYFLSRWENPDCPEYDLDTDELIYRNASGKEIRRERFDGVQDACGFGRPSEEKSISPSMSFLS
jgi:hypothetical protein